jgi:hypothetical protein
MGNRVDRELAQSRQDSEIETEATRQAHYIKWADILGIPDPCGSYPGYQRIMSIYIKYVQCGININNIRTLRSAMVRGYAESVNTLFRLRNMPAPADLSDPNNMSAMLINNMLWEEQIARQRAPLDNKIFAEICLVADAGKTEDLANALLRDVVTLSRYIGPRLSEYAQKNQKKVDIHTYPSGTTIIRAFMANDFIFFDAKKHIIDDLSVESIASAAVVKITWRIQKNRQNGQSITLSADSKSRDLCPILSTAWMVIHARHLLQPDNMPLAIYRTRKGESLYLTGGKIAELLRGLVKRIRPDTSPEDIKRYSAHSLRVLASVLLDEAGKSPDYIKNNSVGSVIRFACIWGTPQ